MAIKLKKDSFTRGLVKRFKLAPHIDRAIAQGEVEWSATFGVKQGDDAFHPSGDCVPSPRALYDKITSLESEPISGSLYKTFQVGHWWHAYIQHVVVDRLGFSDRGQIERKGLRRWGNGAYQWATGFADIAPCCIPGHGEYLVDIKTQGSFDFKQQYLPSWCAGKYEAQINIYMDWFDLDRAIIFCISKDSPHDFKEYEYLRNQPLIDAVYDKWKLVGECIDKQIEPDEDYDPPLPYMGARPV
jgi:hypothetical protein